MQEAPILQPAPQVSIPSSLLQTCPDLPMAADGQMATLLANHVEVARLYHLCAAGKSNLVHAIQGQKGIFIDPMPAHNTTGLSAQPFMLGMLRETNAFRVSRADMVQNSATVAYLQRFGSFLGGEGLRGQCRPVPSGVRAPSNGCQRLYLSS